MGGVVKKAAPQRLRLCSIVDAYSAGLSQQVGWFGGFVPHPAMTYTLFFIDKLIRFKGVLVMRRYDLVFAAVTTRPVIYEPLRDGYGVELYDCIYLTTERGRERYLVLVCVPGDGWSAMRVIDMLNDFLADCGGRCADAVMVSHIYRCEPDNVEW